MSDFWKGFGEAFEKEAGFFGAIGSAAGKLRNVAGHIATAPGSAAKSVSVGAQNLRQEVANGFHAARAKGLGMDQRQYLQHQAEHAKSRATKAAPKGKPAPKPAAQVAQAKPAPQQAPAQAQPAAKAPAVPGARPPMSATMKAGLKGALIGGTGVYFLGSGGGGGSDYQQY